MMLGRENELNYLNTAYAKDCSQIIVVYGRRGVGKTTLLKSFMQDKDVFYYQARETDERGQIRLLAKAGASQGLILEKEIPDEYAEIWQALSFSSGQKKILILENFEQMVKHSASFVPSLTALLRGNLPENIMILLCSSSIGFVENDLVPKIGREAQAISGFLKLRELKFCDLRKFFPLYSVEECVMIYSIFGGVPGLWQSFDRGMSVKENVCKHILAGTGRLRNEGDRPVREQFREPAVYYAILSALSQGNNKLNDLYHVTGFSRAKISVYIKHLIEIEIISKIFSFDTPDKENQKKGIYRISDPFVRFWFCYLYPNGSKLELLSPEQFFDDVIAPSFAAFCNEGFAHVCRETMLQLNAQDPVVEPFAKSGVYEGKNGNIDFIGQEKGGKYIVAFSDFEQAVVTQQTFQYYISVLQAAKLNPERIYLFARGCFDEEMMLKARTNEDLILIGMKDL